MAQRTHTATPARLSTDATMAYLTSGQAHPTIATETDRFTYRLRHIMEGDASFLFVDVLIGKSKYSFAGTIFAREPTPTSRYRYVHGKRTKLLATSRSVSVFRSLLDQLDSGDLRYEVWHDGRCGKCRRQLTVPESIARGIGPLCVNG